ncbi:MAG: NYN domain-containing protein [Lachnospiraceae bacterium]|nr:NYN domain-containing protein [Lachnospiraceae bacterium]
MEEKTQFAVLIDSENVSARYAQIIFDEMEKYGYASVRRIYGNWSTRGNGWNEKLLLEYSITPVQQFSYTQGKNATDMAMVIDAMDLLYQNKVEGFCLVTSDSDFTRLAVRLREENKYVLGMGESKTPKALTRACNRFLLLNLIAESGKENANNNEDNFVTSIEDIEKAAQTLINESSKGRMELGLLGSRLSERFPDFDVRNYGYSKLSVFVEDGLSHFEVVRENNRNFVIAKDKLDVKDIKSEVISIIERNDGSVDNLSVINDELKEKHKGFDIKAYGYSRISSFLRSIRGIKVDENTVRIDKDKEKDRRERGRRSE